MTQIVVGLRLRNPNVPIYESTSTFCQGGELNGTFQGEIAEIRPLLLTYQPPCRLMWNGGVFA